MFRPKLLPLAAQVGRLTLQVSAADLAPAQAREEAPAARKPAQKTQVWQLLCMQKPPDASQLAGGCSMTAALHASCAGEEAQGGGWRQRAAADDPV